MSTIESSVLLSWYENQRSIHENDSASLQALLIEIPDPNDPTVSQLAGRVDERQMILNSFANLLTSQTRQ